MIKVKITKTILLETEIAVPDDDVNLSTINNELEDANWLTIDVYYQIEEEHGKFKFDREGSE
jgi:hypothetical protein